ncbi:hypothetical protein CXF85_13785 [Colwellia sp. 75C3]|uniref:hypothetical protein n=1 Tax=Colwellia sp. 75C3 TaxID=888425 RepID=UPI000C324F73|nr:hypothetical protein [Colwellia sp. 75C3]PKG82548.1 hypothetical protein CXF85_13785 [Colwellia sp. 75C3]
MSNKGLLITFLGPDGAGKTTVGDGLAEAIKSSFNGVERFHLRPSSFSSKNNTVTVVENPHEQSVRGVVPSIAKLIYFIVDYFVGNITKINHLKRKSYLVIFDRYFHDLLIDPIRYRYGAPMWLAKLASYFIPKPDLFIIFDAPTEIIQARKKEVSFEETERQRQAYLAFAKTEPNCIVIDTSVGIDESVRAASTAVFNYIEAKQLKRLKRNEN